MTRVELVDTDVQLAGLSFTREPLGEFEGVFGEWVPAGGTTYDALGANA